MDKFQLINRLIERMEVRRSTVGSRAGVVVTADALLAAASTFIVGKILDGGVEKDIIGTLSLVTTCFSLLFLVLSIFFAVSALMTVWFRSGNKEPAIEDQGLFFHAHPTVKTFNDKGYKTFAEKFKAAPDEEITEYALRYLWLCEKLFDERYQKLKWAVRFLLIATIPFLASMALLLVGSLSKWC